MNKNKIVQVSLCTFVTIILIDFFSFILVIWNVLNNNNKLEKKIFHCLPLVVFFYFLVSMLWMYCVFFFKLMIIIILTHKKKMIIANKSKQQLRFLSGGVVVRSISITITWTSHTHIKSHTQIPIENISNTFYSWKCTSTILYSQPECGITYINTNRKHFKHILFMKMYINNFLYSQQECGIIFIKHNIKHFETHFTNENVHQQFI